MGRKNKQSNSSRILKTQHIASKITEPSMPTKETAVIHNTANLQNGMCDALGFGQNPNFMNPFSGGRHGFLGTGSLESVEDAGTILENLRWYMVSNFRQMLSQAFVEIGLVQTIVCVPVDDGLRGGILLKSKQLNEDEIKQLQLSLDRDGDLETAGWAAKWDRLYGGAGIITLIGDQDPEEPMDLSSITEDTDVEFRDVDMWELFADKQNTEGYNAQLQTQTFEFYNYYAEPIHKSRVMVLKGLKAPSFVRPRLRGWGLSVVEALVRSMNQYLKATDLGFEVLDEFKLDIYKIKNLVNTLLSPNGTNTVKQTVQMLNWQKNYQNAIVMDSEDDFDHKQLSFAGLAEAMEGIRMQVAADMRMPILKLFGQSVSSGSLSSSSAEEMENYNSMVESEVRGKLKYHILRMCEIKCQKMFGMIPDDLELEFKPLRELGAVDQENVKTQKFTRLLQAKQANELTTLEFRDACNKGRIFDVELDTTDSALNDPELSPQDLEDEAGEEKDGTDGESGADKPDSSKIVNELFTFSQWDKLKRFMNSPEFDKASYEADGGDSWIATSRKTLFENPGNVDEALWKRAEDASQAAFGEKCWKFVTWWYKKQGGKFT